MNYQNLNQELNSLNFQKKYFFSIFGLYLFSLGTTILGYSIYLLLESVGIVEKSIITWNAQGLFLFLILFCVSLFVLFVPVEFLNIYKTKTKMAVQHEVKSQLAKLLATEDIVVEHKHVETAQFNVQTRV